MGILDAPVTLASIGAVAKTSPGVPVDDAVQSPDNTLTYLEATVGPAGTMVEGVLSDGTKHMPRIRSEKVTLGGVPFLTAPLLSPMDLIINAGQSNTGTPDLRPAGVPIPDPDPRILYWDETVEKIQDSTTYMANVRQTYAYSVAVEYVKRYLAPGRSVLIVPAGMGSTGFSTSSITPVPAGYVAGPGTWDRTLTADTNNLYARMVARTNKAMTGAPAGSKIVALLWSQGETDSDPGNKNQTQYATLLDDLIATFRTDMSRSDLPVLIGSMNPEWTVQTATRLAIAAAHEDTPRRVERSAYAWGPANLPDFSGEVHWSFQGQEARGAIFIAALYRALYNVTGTEPLPPQNVRATRNGGDLIVSWEHPPCRINSFTLEYSIDGGTWTAAALANPTSRNATLALALTAANKVSVRLRTTNSVGTSINGLEVKA